MDTATKTVIDALTDTVEVIPLTADEIAEREAFAQAEAEQYAAAEAAKEAAQAKLAALGLTTDDLKALGL